MTTMFGWCIDGHHANCILTIDDGKIECSCTCHKPDSVEEEVAE